MIRVPLFVIALGLLAASENPTAVQADETLKIDLTAPASREAWLFPDEGASIEAGELVLDGRRKICHAFYTPREWSDVRLAAEFCVEPQSNGVLACGFIVRAADSRTFYYVHFDRGQAILVKSTPEVAWTEIKRIGGLKKPAGEWHTAELECNGHTLRVSLNGKPLYEATDRDLARGRVGFYGSQGLVRVRNITVAGRAETPEQEFRVPPRPYVFVCEDAGAGGYEAFPDVCRLNDGRLMAVFYAGYGHVALPNEKLPKGGRISYCLSSDEGATWTPAAPLYDGPDDDRDPSIVQLKNGRLICNFFSLRKTDGKSPPWTGLGTWIITSDDLGQTWSEPRQVAADAYCSSPIRVLSSGRLILGLYTASKTTATGAVAYSDDGGETWSDVVEMDNGGVRLDAETDLIERKDGSLYAALRAKMCYSVSRDQGKTWTVAEPMGFPGHSPYFLRTKDDIVVLAFRLPKTSLRFSRDDCETWSENVPVDSVIGAYPSMVNLNDGSVLIVYYEEGPGSNLRAKRFRIGENGVEWLPPFPAVTAESIPR